MSASAGPSTLVPTRLGAASHRAHHAHGSRRTVAPRRSLAIVRCSVDREALE